MSGPNDTPTQQMPAHRGQHDCRQEALIHELRRDLKDTRDRLGNGDVCLATLALNMEQLRKSVEALDGSVKALAEAQAKPNPVASKVIDSLISWAVPVALAAVAWVLVNSGAVPVRQLPAPTTTGTTP